jgi:hypothetical protein
MMDSRIIDINFSRPFMRLVLEQEMPLTIASVRVSRWPCTYTILRGQRC